MSAPVVTSVNPSSGTNGTLVVIGGFNFTNASMVLFGSSQSIGFNVDSDTQITAPAPGGIGTVDVTVTTPSGTSAITPADRFTYTGSSPVINGISPARGPTPGGTTVTISGSGFTGITAVKFGTVPATSFSFLSDGSIQAVSPPQGAGQVHVTVTTPSGISSETDADLFTYIQGPIPCFLRGTRILCYENGQETTVPIENIRNGTLVKTLKNGYLPVTLVGKSNIYNSGNDERIPNRLYECQRTPADQQEKLVITGAHAILLNQLTPDQQERVTYCHGNRLPTTEGMYQLMAFVDSECTPFSKSGVFEVRHLVLGNDDSINYGIYANGVIVETCFVGAIQRTMEIVE